MIRAYGDGKGDEEFVHAMDLRAMLMGDRFLEVDRPEISIISSVQCHGRAVEDIDIVLFGSISKDDTYAGSRIAPVLKNIRNFVVVVEVKRHQITGLKFEGTRLKVKRTDHDITGQNRSQMFSLLDFLREHDIIDDDSEPWVSNMVYLPNVSKDAMYQMGHVMDLDGLNVLFKDSDIEDLFRIITMRRPPGRGGRGRAYQAMDQNDFDMVLPRMRKLLTDRIEYTELDRKRMENLVRMAVKDQLYVKKLGKQLLRVQGRGGTGKTYRLLQYAFNFYHKDNDRRIMILTYNRALVADIKRLLAIMRRRKGLDENIQIRTIHSFIGSLMKAADVAPESGPLYGPPYDDGKRRLLEALKDTAHRDRILRDKWDLKWDHIMVDEAQDTPDDERDILIGTYGHRKLIIADGYDQLIRSDERCEWRETEEIKKNSQTITLRRSLRQASGLNRVVDSMAQELGVHDWDIDENDILHGGKVIVLMAPYTQEFHERILGLNKEAGNENVDLLFCVPPRYKDKDTGHSFLYERFTDWGYLVWDGVHTGTRRSSYPTSVDQLRVVQYESCRGLEGWMSINVGFDKFLDAKFKEARTRSFPDGGLLSSREDLMKEFVSRWAMIPLTRAIHTLVLHIEDPKDDIVNMLERVSKRNEDMFEWIRD